MGRGSVGRVRRGAASQAGIVDRVSFEVMRRLGISQAFTNAAHFRAAGFETLFSPMAAAHFLPAEQPISDDASAVVDDRLTTCA